MGRFEKDEGAMISGCSGHIVLKDKHGSDSGRKKLRLFARGASPAMPGILRRQNKIVKSFVKSFVDFF